MAIVAPRRTRRPVGMVLQLQLKQRNLGLGEGEFAALLGLDRSWWYRLRIGEVEPSPDLLRRVMELWPGEFDGFLREVVLGRPVRREKASNGA
jgi:hypothetical protein